MIAAQLKRAIRQHEQSRQSFQRLEWLAANGPRADAPLYGTLAKMHADFADELRDLLAEAIRPGLRLALPPRPRPRRCDGHLGALDA